MADNPMPPHQEDVAKITDLLSLDTLARVYALVLEIGERHELDARSAHGTIGPPDENRTPSVGSAERS